MILDTLYGILIGSFNLLREMAPYLLLGFLVAGILNEFVTPEKIARHLGRASFSSVLKAALFGIPLPLCSCGVIPPTAALRKAGAGHGAVLSFLIATPTSGVDSIAATYSLMGPFFAAYRVVASFIAAIFTGTVANLLKFDDVAAAEKYQTANGSVAAPLWIRFVRVLHFGLVKLLSEIAKWLVIGILIGGVITYFLPDNFFGAAVPPGILTILLMIVIAVPIYVCATGSIPIAAALMLKGLNPGAAFVFLLAGPATNSVTITVISKLLGKKSTVVYLAGIIISSVGLGLLLDLLWSRLGLHAGFAHHHHRQLLPTWLMTGSTVALLVLLSIAPISTLIQKMKRPKPQLTRSEMTSIFYVPGMTCNNCVAHVKKAAESVDGVEQAVVNLATKKVEIYHADRTAREQIMRAIEEAGYEAKSSL